MKGLGKYREIIVYFLMVVRFLKQNCKKGFDGIGGHTYLALTDAALTASTANNASVANRDGQPAPR